MRGPHFRVRFCVAFMAGARLFTRAVLALSNFVTHGPESSDASLLIDVIPVIPVVIAILLFRAQR